MKNGNKEQLFSCGHCPALLWERALSEASFSQAFAWMSSPPGTATPNRPDQSVLLGAAENVRSTEEEGPVRDTVYCPTRALLLLCCCFHGPEKKQHKVDLNTASVKAMGTSLLNSINQATKSSLLHNAFLDLPVIT